MIVIYTAKDSFQILPVPYHYFSKLILPNSTAFSISLLLSHIIILYYTNISLFLPLSFQTLMSSSQRAHFPTSSSMQFQVFHFLLFQPSISALSYLVSNLPYLHSLHLTITFLRHCSPPSLSSASYPFSDLQFCDSGALSKALLFLLSLMPFPRLGNFQLQCITALIPSPIFSNHLFLPQSQLISPFNMFTHDLMQLNTFATKERG